MRPLIVYFKSETYFKHSRRVYIAARTKKEASEISGHPVGHFDKNYCRQFPAGAPEVPPFILAEGCWLEIRDLDREGSYEPEWSCMNVSDRSKDRVPTNEAAFIRCATLEACKESFTLKLDRALAAAGVPREEL
jgi:hypothetical protein